MLVPLHIVPPAAPRPAQVPSAGLNLRNLWNRSLESAVSAAGTEGLRDSNQIVFTTPVRDSFVLRTRASTATTAKSGMMLAPMRIGANDS